MQGVTATRTPTVGHLMSCLACLWERALILMSRAKVMVPLARCAWRLHRMPVLSWTHILTMHPHRVSPRLLCGSTCGHCTSRHGCALRMLSFDTVSFASAEKCGMCRHASSSIQNSSSFVYVWLLSAALRGGRMDPPVCRLLHAGSGGEISMPWGCAGLKNGKAEFSACPDGSASLM